MAGAAGADRGAAGPLGGEVLASTRRRWTIRVLVLIWVVPLVVATWGWAIDQRANPELPVSFRIGLAAVALLSALAVVLGWISEHVRRVVVTSQGIARRGLRGWRVLRWDDIEELRMWVRSSRWVPHFGAAVALGQMMTPGRSFEERVGHAGVARISGADGSLVRFTSLDRGWLEAFRLAESRTRERLANGYARRLSAQEPLVFGRLRLDHAGLRVGKVTVAWSDLDALRLHEGYLHVVRKADQPGPHVSANGVPNTAALISAVASHAPSRRS
ncbi:MAG: PH domain-containing protein [Deltaproteobacteria bacterium]|nr:PH domain-containing protein [Deltaproteobacteria bacterium]